MTQKRNFLQVAENIASLTGCSKATAEVFLKTAFALLADFIQDGFKVKIKGIGTFVKTDNAEDPIMYIPDKSLSDAVNLPFSSFEAVELDDMVTDDLLEKEIAQMSEDNDDVDTEFHVESGDSDQKTIIEDEEIDVVETESENPIVENTYNDIDATVDDNTTFEDEIIDECGQREITEVASIDSDNEEVVSHEVYDSHIKEIGSQCVRLPIFIISIFVSMAIGFCAGYMVKVIMENNALKEQVIKQQAQIDSMSTNVAVMDSLETPATINDTTSKELPDTSKIDEPTIDSQNANVKFDKIKTNRFLTTMAREYYGNMNFWVYIYEENKAMLGHPNKIKPGTVVKIPPAEKYNIDANNPQSVQKAEIKAVEIYSQYQN